MKVLYAIQGTGNGHLCRALDVVPVLQKKFDVDILVSGTQGDISLPFDIKYQLKGLSFVFGKKGGVNLAKTISNTNFRTLFREIRSLPLHEYDLIINDFEPISAWAAKFRRRKCIALSHQCAVLNKKAPKPNKIDFIGENILKYYAPTSKTYGFHFESFGPKIYTPVIRQQIRCLKPTDQNFYTVYLPSYSDEKLMGIFSNFPNEQWDIFSKHNKQAITLNNITIRPINNEAFITSLVSCKGVICGAGFETPAEAMYLNKKLLVVPMKNQYEQHCNAAALKSLGITVLPSLNKKHFKKIRQWLQNGIAIKGDFPDHTELIIDEILSDTFESAIYTELNKFPI